MLAMAEVALSSQENFFWDFPNLGAKEDLNCNENYAKMSNSNDGGDGDSEEVVVTAAAAAAATAEPTKGGRKRKKKNKDVKEISCSEHDLHIWTERERRKKMRSMFANLHALLPHLPPKADKTSIVDEAVNHIKKLQQGLEELRNKKLQRLHGQTLTIQSREAFLADQCSPAALPPPPHRVDFMAPVFKTWTSPNVTLSLSGNDAHISVCSVRKPGLLSAICFAMEKHKLDIVSAQISSDWNRCMYIFHARANVGSERMIQTFPVEAIYKQAVAEIMLWINS